MNEITVTKELKFCAAHRLTGYTGPCKNIHGHNYRVFLTLASRALSQSNGLLQNLGMVIDFGIIKEKLQTWIDNFLDHALIINEKDFGLINFADSSKMKYHVLNGNATAENLALLIFNKAQQIFVNGRLEGPNLDYTDSFKVIAVKVYETDTCYAEVKCNTK
jgi:6-pyruvoyltetrahydropterin/6-carboxytetrahydropterin synthase